MSSFRDDLLASLPSLRAFAMSLIGDRDRADDLVQETLLRALQNQDKFEEGSNLIAWLFTILRNCFYSRHRKLRREVEDVDGAFAMRLEIAPTQLNSIELQECMRALAKLPVEQREALLLVTIHEMAYEEVAEICDCAIGTIKSRVNRARNAMAFMLGRDRATGEALDGPPVPRPRPPVGKPARTQGSALLA